MKNYSIYTVDGKELPNKQEILNNHFGPVFESVLNRLTADMYGIVHRIYMNNIKCYIIRTSDIKWRLY